MTIEIDYCPQCRGVWLDRGELDKIIAHSVSEITHAAPPAVLHNAPHPMQPQYGAQPYGYREGHHDSHRGDHREKKSIWRELFD
jgi:Zn-finger nucleic acid-binding protein